MGNVEQQPNTWLSLRIREFITSAISYTLPVNIVLFKNVYIIKYFRHIVLGRSLRCSSHPGIHDLV